MKVLPILAALLLTPMIAVAQNVTTISNDGDKIIITPPPKGPTSPVGLMQSQLVTDDVSFVWVTDGDVMRVAVFHDADPKAICEMADKFGVKLESVRNNNVVASCAKPE